MAVNTNAHWEIPQPSDSKITYSKTAGGTFWKMEVERFKTAKAILVNGAGLSVSSNNISVVPMDDLVFKGKEGMETRRTVEFYCAYDGTTLIEARRNGNVETVLQVYVRPVNTKGLPSIVQLNHPHAALNAIDSPVKYKMDSSFVIKSGEKAGAMFKRIPKTVKHLAFSSHGAPGSIYIGEGLSMDNVKEFAALKNSNLKVIWIGGCSVAGNDEGDAFCREIIKYTGCYVVAPAITLVTKLILNAGQVEVFSSNMPHYFAPNGIKLSQSDFFNKQLTLGFKVI